MSRPHIPFAVADVSAFAKSLRSQLAGRESLPSHVELLNMLAKAGGHRNFQHFRAGAIAGPMMRETEPRLDSAEVEQVLRHFDAQGRMMRWPGKTNHQLLCLWAIWARIPSGERFSEAEINAFINAGHSFGDHAILRRGMVDEGLLARTPDGRVYRRIEQVPPPEGQAVISEILRRGTRE